MSDRLANGHFATGNKYGHGNPYLKRMGQLRRKLAASIEPQDLIDIGMKLKDMALDGNVHAAKLLLDHVLGKPPQSVAVTGPEGTPLNLSLADIQLAVFQAIGNDTDTKVKIATALRQLTHKEQANGQGDA